MRSTVPVASAEVNELMACFLAALALSLFAILLAGIG
jgi:hypothetical protein